MVKQVPEKECHNLWALLAQTTDLIRTIRQKELDQYDISPMHIAVLFVIQAIGSKATPSEIAQWIFRQPHSVSELISRMEERGLVKKVKDLKRKNQVRVTITEKGREAYQLAKRKSIQRIMSSLSEEQLQQLRSSLEILRAKALEGSGIKERPFPRWL